MVSDLARRRPLVLFVTSLLWIGCEAQTWAQRDLELYEHAFDDSLLLVTEELHPAVVGKPYTAPLKATGQYKPYRWSIVSGRLPDGITIRERGVIEGTPEIPEVATFVVKVHGGVPGSAGAEFGGTPHISSRMRQLTLVVKRVSGNAEKP
jgi:hypothetical protein